MSKREFVSPLRVSDGEYLIEIADVSRRNDEREYAIAIWEFRVYGDGFKDVSEALNSALSNVEKLRGSKYWSWRKKVSSSK